MVLCMMKEGLEDQILWDQGLRERTNLSGFLGLTGEDLVTQT